MQFNCRASSRAGVVFSGARPPLGLSFESSSYPGAHQAESSVSRISAPAIFVSEHVDEERLCWTRRKTVTVSPGTSKTKTLSLLCWLVLAGDFFLGFASVQICRAVIDHFRSQESLTGDGTGTLSTEDAPLPVRASSGIQLAIHSA